MPSYLPIFILTKGKTKQNLLQCHEARWMWPFTLTVYISKMVHYNCMPFWLFHLLSYAFVLTSKFIDKFVESLAFKP